MAIKQVGTTKNGGVKSYQCLTTDLKATWPTNCLAGSSMTVLNASTKVVDRFEYFDGTDWYVL